MRRIDEACLDLRNDRWYLECWDKKTKYFIETDILFTGLILFPDGGSINDVAYKNEVKICQDGVIVGDYTTHPYFSKLIDFKSALKTSWGNLDIGREWELDTYKEKPFTGIAYLEEKNKDGFSYIDQEILYENGSPRDTLKYFEDGSLKALEFRNNFDMECSEPKTLSFLSIDKDYFTKYPKLEQTSLDEDVIEDASSFRRFRANKRLSFSGEGVNDDIFNALWENGGMDELEELNMRGISIGQSSYYKLLNLPRLSSLDIEITIDMMSEVADTIKFVGKELKEKGIEVSLKMNKKMIEV